MNRYFFLVFIIIGIGGLIACAYTAIGTLDFLNRTVTTDAIVVDIVEKRVSDGWSYYPLFQFVDLNGVEVHARGAWNIAFDIGQEFEIFYDPENPSGVVYTGYLNIWGPSLILLVFGLCFTGVGSYAFLNWGRLKNFWSQ